MSINGEAVKDRYVVRNGPFGGDVYFDNANLAIKYAQNVEKKFGIKVVIVYQEAVRKLKIDGWKI